VSSLAVLDQAGQSSSPTTTALLGSVSGADGGRPDVDGQTSSGLLTSLATVPGQADDSASSPGEIAQTAAVAQPTSSGAEPVVDAEAVPGISTVLPGVDLDDDPGFTPSRRRTGMVSDSVLDDLASGFLPRGGQEEGRAVVGPGLVSIGIVEDADCGFQRSAASDLNAGICDSEFPDRHGVWGVPCDLVITRPHRL
jgi:hypothetical protein